MPAVEIDVNAARLQLERVLASSGFSRNERMARFLRFIVEQHLAGKDSELKESVIAIEVFGRRPDHDPSQDSIVQTEAGRLRARLSEYYAREGKGDALVIELPKGGYAPLLRRLEAGPPNNRRDTDDKCRTEEAIAAWAEDRASWICGRSGSRRLVASSAHQYAYSYRGYAV
jgi:hypothetical protein